MSTSAELIGLLRDAKLHPDDDALRLILADWLEEHGQPEHAEFVRLQLRERDPVDAARMDALWSAHAAGWLGVLVQEEIKITPKRGLLEVAGPANRFFTHHLGRLGRLGRLKDHESLAWIEKLTMLEMTPARLKKLAESPHWGVSASLRLRGNARRGGDGLIPREFWGDSSEDWTPLSQLPGADQLRHLSLVDCQLGASGIAALAEANLSALTRLEMSNASLGDVGVERFVQRTNAMSLHSLAMTRCRIAARGITALANWPGLGEVRSLNLNFSYPGTEGVAALAASPHRSSLEELHLSTSNLTSHESLAGQHLGLAGVCALVDAEPYVNLESLVLSGQRLGRQGAQILSTATCFPALRRLGLVANQLRCEGVYALLNAPWLPQLDELNLTYNELRDPAGQAIATCDRFAPTIRIILTANSDIGTMTRERLTERFGTRVCFRNYG